MILTKEQIIRLNAKVFADKTREILLELDTLLPHLVEEGGDSRLLRTFYRGMAAFRGAGRIFGFEDVSRLAEAVMGALEPARNGERAVTPELLKLAVEANQQIHKMVEVALRESDSDFFSLGAGKGSDGDGSEPIDFDLHHVERLIADLQRGNG